MDFSLWMSKLRNLLQEKEQSLTLVNGHWNIGSRKELLYNWGARIFDCHLDTFKECAIEVLSESDPQFELPGEKRFAASIYGKKLKYSADLRQGLAEFLALLGVNGDALVHASIQKAENTVVFVLREIFKKSDWKGWASLNNLLPTLAEANPRVFLTSVEEALKQGQSPFEEIFAQEGDGITGNNYMTGLLWALECLSWDEEYLMHSVSILADLASLDPGGNWGNRPVNSIISILLPWHPQTLASLEKRYRTVESLIKEFPEIAWQVILKLLPNQHQTTSGTYKPRWRNPLPEDWKVNVTNIQYYEQVKFYSKCAVEMACEDLNRLTKLIDNLDNLPKPSFEAILKHIASPEITKLEEPDRLPIWLNLVGFANKHRRFSDAEWALNDTLISEIENTAAQIAPISLEGQYRRFFSNKDFDLYEKNGDWKEQSKKLDERRQQAIKEILDASGIERVLIFVNNVESPFLVGFALGKIINKKVDDILIPSYLKTDKDAYLQFMNGFIRSRFFCQKWKWVDGLDRTNWTYDESCRFLMNLPFDDGTWLRVGKWLDKSENLYWNKVIVNPFEAENDLLPAVKKLLEVSRPYGAINCLYCQSHKFHKNLPLDITLTVKALLDATSIKNSIDNIDTYHIIELIKALQNNPNTNNNDLLSVEWAYLSLLKRTNNSEAKFLNKNISTNPEFFGEMISFAYRSTYEKETDKEPSEERKKLASNAWNFFHEWKRPPGLQDDGSFSVSDFKKWLKDVKKICSESGHSDVAMITIGEVLFYCPSDQDLWIIKEVAQTLNAKNADKMRNGYYTEAINSIGVHRVSTMEPLEQQLAKEWRQKAEDVENAGYIRFAVTLKSLADHFEHEAKRIIERERARNNS